MDDYGYGLWPLVVVNSLVVILFAASFFHPRSTRDWRVLGGFSAFVVALFTEMHGYPLTVYPLSGPFSGLVPGVDLSHNSGHLWTDLVGWNGDPHVSPFHLASYVFIIGGFWLITLLVVYRRLALREEREVESRFSDSWGKYAARATPFFPRLGPLRAQAGKP